MKSTNHVVANALNSVKATNADTEASIDAEANKLYAQLKDIAKKFDSLQSRLTKIHVYFTDYKATANGIRELHGMQ